MASHTLLMKNLKKWLCVMVCIYLSGCASNLRIDGPYEGKVIDAETKQPIEGAVVHGSWSKLHATVGGAVGEYYDSYEMLTDRNGEFKIPGKGLLILSRIDGMTLTIFKAGYKQWTPNSWRGLKKGKWPNDELVWQGDKGIFRLQKMTMDERRNKSIEMPLSEPSHKLKLFIRESNKEMIEIGRPSSTLGPEE
jgi:hypothetical protein